MQTWMFVAYPMAVDSEGNELWLSWNVVSASVGVHDTMYLCSDIFICGDWRLRLTYWFAWQQCHFHHETVLMCYVCTCQVHMYVYTAVDPMLYSVWLSIQSCLARTCSRPGFVSTARDSRYGYTYCCGWLYYRLEAWFNALAWQLH